MDLGEALAGVAKNSILAERRRIRRLIAPHLDPLADVILECACETIGFSPCSSCSAKEALKAIDAATKAPRKARKGK